MMPRDSLKPFRNRLVTVSGQVVLMHHGGRYGRYLFTIIQECYLEI